MILREATIVRSADLRGEARRLQAGADEHRAVADVASSDAARDTCLHVAGSYDVRESTYPARHLAILVVLTACAAVTAPAAAQAPTDTSECREFTTQARIDGEMRPLVGRACRQLDGSWRMTEATIPPPQAATVYPAPTYPYYAYDYSYYPFYPRWPFWTPPIGLLGF